MVSEKLWSVRLRHSTNREGRLSPWSCSTRPYAGTRYAALVYTGIDNGIEANKALLNWGAEKGLAWDTYAAENGDGFGARIESHLSGPADEPDPAQWETEVAIRLADHQPR